MKSHAKKRGAALIVALFVISMLAVLVVAILSLVGGERKTWTAYAGQVDAKVLANSALNAVVAQIRDATTVPEGESWASQPGMIRRFHSTVDPATGRAAMTRAYKLYSAEKMVVEKAVDLDEDLPPKDWAEQRGIWVDLNEPHAIITDGDGTPENRVFPILDPRSDAKGFAVSDAPGASEIQPAPMPVRWIYFLKDGTMAAAKQSSGSEKARVLGASKENPVVGRFAFWSDDETSKLNVNTASEPTPWDTPRAISKRDVEFAKFQPALNEFQRYPGHPAMTALSPVIFPHVALLNLDQKKAIYDMLPRVEDGGSRGGTIRNNPSNAFAIPDGNRLFASLDELLFDQSRGLNKLIDPERLGRSRFFLTAHSRAPEINLHGFPRVVCWPIDSRGKSFWSAHDELAKFCGTIGGREFYFQRSDATSQSTDVQIRQNRRLIAYLQKMMKRDVPGFGGNFATKWGRDADQMLLQTFDYIRATNLRSRVLNAEGTLVPPYTTNGQVTPSSFEDKIGFGRVHSISEFGLHFICRTEGAEGTALTPAERKAATGSETGVLSPQQRLIEAAFLMEPFSVAQGFFRLTQTLTYEVSGLEQFRLNDQPMGFDPKIVYHPNASFGSGWHGRSWGGSQGVRTFIQNKGGSYPLKMKTNPYNSRLPNAWILTDGNTMKFTGGKVVVKIFSGTAPDASNLIQTLEVNLPSATFPVPKLVRTGTSKFRGSGATNPQYWQTLASRYSRTSAGPSSPSVEYADPTRHFPQARNGDLPGFKQGGVFRAEDVVRTVSPKYGDMRLIAGLKNVPTSRFAPHYFYNDLGCNLAHIFCDSQGSHFLFAFGNEPGVRFARGLNQKGVPKERNAQLTEANYHFSRLPDVPFGTGEFNRWGDFDNGSAQVTDGSYINKPDEGNVSPSSVSGNDDFGYYYWNFTESFTNMFSPNRMMPSPGMFGSLPTGVLSNQPWQTLLLRPQPGHPGEKSCPDHTYLDLFWMPVVEPYAISEPFSTAGKINLNYAIAPFSYIRRATALHGLMKSEEILAIPNSLSLGYKLWEHETSDHPDFPDNFAMNKNRASGEQWKKLFDGSEKVRRPIDVEKTLTQFDERFEQGDIFRSPSEICTVHLVREGDDLSSYRSGKFWADHVLTGENTRERPYTNLHARLTTQSNTYRAHFIVESIQQARSTSAEEVDLDKDVVTGRYRGTAVIERYIDPNDPALPDFSVDQSTRADRFYRFRVIEEKEFRP